MLYRNRNGWNRALQVMKTCIYFAYQKDLGFYFFIFNISFSKNIEDTCGNKLAINSSRRNTIIAFSLCLQMWSTFHVFTVSPAAFVLNMPPAVANFNSIFKITYTTIFRPSQIGCPHPVRDLCHIYPPQPIYRVNSTSSYLL